MTLEARVAGTARTLALVVLGRSALLGMALTWASAALLSPFTGIRTAVVLAATVGVALAAILYRRLRGPGFTIPAVSLWIEEHVPALDYGLVTAIEGKAPTSLERSVATVDWSGATRDAARKALGVPLAVAVGAALLFAASISFAPVVSRVAHRIGPAARGGAGAISVTVEVVPPSYTRRRSESFSNPPVVRALVGSQLRLLVSGSDSFAVSAGDGELPRGTSWRVTSQPIALRVRAGDHSRLIAVDPVADSAPAVVMRDPVRDTVLLVPQGTFALGADIRDDIGLRRAAFEYIVSSGSGETFTFAAGITGATQLNGATARAISSRLSLASLNLKPGDFVHIRAVAYDLRDDTAAARGASETRTIRIARAGEFDSVSVDAAAPPEADKAVLSQRMLINLTEALVRRRPRLARETFGDESRTIGRDQSRLRKQVGDLVFARLGDDPSGEHFHGDGHEHEGQELRPALTPEELLKAAENATASAAGKVLDFEGDETPVVAVNRPLLEAYNFMWDASRELNQASPERALPSMYKALEAIQRARAAERLYLRSRPSRAVVDVDRVRLQGKEKGTPAAREPRSSLGSSPATGVARGVLARFARVVALSTTNPYAAADSLLLLRIDLLGSIPADAATAAAQAADALRNGRDAVDHLAAVRRSLGPAMTTSDSLPHWRGIP
jgi:hypothetical protein